MAEGERRGCASWLGIGLVVLFMVAGISTIFDEDEPEPTMQAVPLVEGSPLDQAKDDLRDAGFTRVDSVDDGGGDRSQWVDSNWIVVAQDPAAGAEQMTDEQVTLRVIKEAEVDDEPDRVDAPSAPPMADEEPYSLGNLGCHVDALGFPTATGTITNDDVVARSFNIWVEFTTSGGVRLDEANDIIFDLRPGQTGAWEAGGTADITERTTCKVLNVEVL